MKYHGHVYSGNYGRICVSFDNNFFYRSLIKSKGEGGSFILVTSEKHKFVSKPVFDKLWVKYRTLHICTLSDKKYLSFIFIHTLSKDVVTPSVRPSVRRISCHLNSVYILSRSQIIFSNLIGHVLQMRSKVWEFLYLPQGSIKGQKWLFWWSYYLKNYVYILQKRQMILWDIIWYVLQMWNKVSEFSFYLEGSNEGRKTTVFFC